MPSVRRSLLWSLFIGAVLFAFTTLLAHVAPVIPGAIWPEAGFFGNPPDFWPDRRYYVLRPIDSPIMMAGAVETAWGRTSIKMVAPHSTSLSASLRGATGHMNVWAVGFPFYFVSHASFSSPLAAGSQALSGNQLLYGTALSRPPSTTAAAVPASMITVHWFAALVDLLMHWLVGFVLIAVWLKLRYKRNICPDCGFPLLRDQSRCSECGLDRTTPA
jgi:hypothetical protein